MIRSLAEALRRLDLAWKPQSLEYIDSAQPEASTDTLLSVPSVDGGRDPVTRRGAIKGLGALIAASAIPFRPWTSVWQKVLVHVMPIDSYFFPNRYPCHSGERIISNG